MNARSRRQRRLSGVLALVCFGSLVAIYLELDEAPISREARSMPAAGAAASPQVPDLAFAMPPLSTYAEIAARPLFSPLRRPPEKTEAAAPDASEPPPRAQDLLLRGVASAGSSRIALLERRSTGELLRVLEGQVVDGWRIDAIGSDTVALLADDDAYLLELELDDAQPPAEAGGRRAPNGGPPEAPADAEEPPVPGSGS